MAPPICPTNPRKQNIVFVVVKSITPLLEDVFVYLMFLSVYRGAVCFIKESKMETYQG